MQSRRLVWKHFQRTAMLVAFCALARGDELIIRPPITDANLNNVAGNYSNSDFTYDSSSGGILGGDFHLGVTAIVNHLSLWVVGSQDVNGNPGFEWSNLRLYMGEFWDTVGAVSTGYSYAPVTYPNGANYESHSTSGLYYQMWKITFSLPDLVIEGGIPYVFGWTGTPLSSGWAENIHTTNDCGNLDWTERAGICADSTLDLLTADGSGYSYAGWYNENAAGRPIGYVNVEVTGNVVPEPTAFALTGVALCVIGLARRRK